MNETKKVMNPLIGRDQAPEFTYELVEGSMAYKLCDIHPNLFLSNMLMVDSLMHKIISEMIVISMQSSVKDLPELIKRVEKSNPLGYDLSGGHSYYAHKMKGFLIGLVRGLNVEDTWIGSSKKGIALYEVHSKDKTMAFNAAQIPLLGEYLINHARIVCEVTERTSEHIKVKLMIELK